MIMTFEYKNLLLLKSPQNNVASNIAVTENKQRVCVSCVPGTLCDKVTDFADEPVAQCDLAAVKNTSINDGDNDNYK